MTEITTPQLEHELHSPHVKVIDTRPVDAYNGWRLRGESRGGHITSARSLPHKWTNYIDWFDTVESKELHPTDKLILYGYDPEQTREVARRLQRAGFADIALYHRFVSDWSPNPKLPVSRMPRFRQLVPASWLHGLIRTGTASELDNQKFVVCHAHYHNRNDYELGHIPGAIALDTNSLESPDTWNRRSPRELKETLEQLGITHDTTAILYGRFSSPSYDSPFPGSSAGHLGAFRCAVLMMYAGVKDVRILNGGMQAWLDSGLPVTTDETHVRPATNFGLSVPQHPELIIDTDEAKEFLSSPEKNLVSTRSWREHIGQISGYHYIRRKGRIPGAVFANASSDAYHMDSYRNVDHTTREYHEIEQQLARAGVTPSKHNAFYCGTGWRGSEAFFNAWLMGWPHIYLYDGGWFEWSNNDTNPCETGIPEPAHELHPATKG